LQQQQLLLVRDETDQVVFKTDFLFRQLSSSNSFEEQEASRRRPSHWYFAI
jgi:hypothetical protein